MKKFSRIGCVVGLAGLLLVPLSMLEAQAGCYQGWVIWGHSGKVYTGDREPTKGAKSNPLFLARNKAKQNWSELIVKYGYGEGFSHWEYACNKHYYCYHGSDWGSPYYACDVIANPGEPYTAAR